MGLIKEILKTMLLPLGIKSKLDIAILWRYRNHLLFTLKMLKNSHSQMSQDVFVACELRLWEQKDEELFFVEFGATNGIDLSNTYLLETCFNGQGILVEPAKVWHEELVINRKCKIDFRCVDSHSGESITFNETQEGVYSTIDNFSRNDFHSKKRLGGRKYRVETVSLNDLLNEMDAPKIIDYLSIDTEGSEFQIIESVNFEQSTFKVITIEHNYSKNREKIFTILSANGYQRILENLTKMEDWYIKYNSK